MEQEKEYSLADLVESVESFENDIEAVLAKLENKSKIEIAKTRLQEKETKRYEAIQKQKDRQRKAIRAMLEHTGGNIPELYNKVNEELRALMQTDKKLEFDNISFSEETAAFRIPKFAESFNLDGASDFFGMTMAEQFLLYDRIGLFKGIVIDHSKETPVDQGYRNVVKFVKENEGDNPASKPVTVFYKKPRVAGFFETTFSLDESQRKSQESGIFNLGFGLSVDYNYWATSAAVRAGFSYSKDWLIEKNIQVKKIAITSNFFLPKIELSFDTLKPCADDSLISHVEAIFSENCSDVEKFEKLNIILMGFGHFVPSNLVVGGRLYSSDLKEIRNTSEIDNAMTNYAANFQAAFSTLRTEVGVEAKTTHQSSNKSATESKNENQNLKLNAIGGEGAYVNDTEKWVKSTEKFTSWGLVRFDDLVPVINVLPKELKEQCVNLFDSIVDQLSIEEILQRNAHYLFYKGYYERFGVKAQPKFYVIKNKLSDTHVLSLSNDKESVNFTPVVLKPFDRSNAQFWYITPYGKIYSKESYGSANRLVLSLDDNKAAVVTMDDYFENQFWKIGGGKIVNNNGFALVEKDKTSFEVSNDANAIKKSVWLMNTEQEFLAMRTKVPVQTTTRKFNQVNNVNQLMNGQCLTLTDSLVSSNGKIKLAFDKKQLTITYSDTKVRDKVLYTEVIDPAGKAQKIGMVEGTIEVMDEQGKFIKTLWADNNSYINMLKLLDNGNLEALDRNEVIVWDSKSIIYSTVQNSRKDVLSIHHSDFDPDMSYPSISLTNMPFVEADHQLWYVNSNNQLICKAMNNGKRFGLACDRNGSLTVSGNLSPTNMEVQWNIPKDNYGILENKGHQKKVRSEEPGVYLNADGTNEMWTLTPQPDLFGKTKVAKVKKPVMKHERNTDYLDFYEGDTKIHTNYVDLTGKEIRAVKLYPDNGRYKIKFKDVNGNEIKDNSSGNDYSAFTPKVTRFQRSPLYLVPNAEKVGLSFITNDTYGLKMMKDGSKISNSDKNYISMSSNVKEVRFLDLNWVEANENEKVIGFGFGVAENRLVPYIVTIPK